MILYAISLYWLLSAVTATGIYACRGEHDSDQVLGIILGAPLAVAYQIGAAIRERNNPGYRR